MSQVTKKALAAALKDQLLKKPLHKITINDITEECGINRMTFYYHFKDIYDLVEWACLEDASRALQGKKTYETWVTGYVPGAEIRLSRPICLDGYTIRPPKVQLIGSQGQKARFRITIHEGRNRQVRRMCEAAGMTVTRLKRIQEGTLRLGDLPLGKWRFLTEDEKESLLGADFKRKK